ncbi:MAG: cytochrome ubiquinol oxidase subunit I [Acidobacteria bacterium]|nr:MAG: cytochrome ubiquinol oxidase subunit I [Acidobacteriota bacterium]
MVTSFIFFLLGGVLAAMMRWQLSQPEHGAIGPDLYNQIFTVHGSTMIFLFAVPMMFQGFGVYLVPLICGTRNIAFPRLCAFSYYLYVVGGLLLWAGLLLKTGADAGWFAYVPLSGPEFTPGKRSDFWAQMITFTEVSALGVAICIATTILRYRAPGMTLNRMPIILWEKLVISMAVIFAMPAVMVVSSMLLMDRTINTQFFNPSVGGDVLLYQHLFWFFGHPDVYIIFLPGTAIASTLIPVFSRRHTFGYIPIVTSVVATAFLGFGVWVHHMFATGLPQMSESFFTAATLMIVIPTAVQFYCWMATIWYGRLQLKLPMLWIFGFLFVFLIGGLSGVMLASVPVDWQVHDTFFVVAHFHYVLIGGALFPMFAGLYFWIPKITGRMMNDFLGLRGMPRRVYTYTPDMHWRGLNLLASSGVLFMTAGMIVFIVNFFQSRAGGRLTGPDPWAAGSLEWAIPSPPPVYNFLELPTVNGREALWDAVPNQPIVTGVRDDVPEVLVTNSLDSEPQHKDEVPGPSIWPFLTAIAVSIAFIWSIFSPWGVAYGAIPVVVTLIGWLWPRGHSPSPRIETRVEETWIR